MLTAEQIKDLATRKDVKTIAVQNFLGTLGGSTAYEARKNFEADAKSYRWNGATKKAIRDGLAKHFKTT